MQRLVLVTLVLVTVLALAFPGAPTARAEDVVVTLAPGQTAKIPLDLWCLNYGKPFPTAIEGPTTRPPDEVVRVMQTAIKKGAVIADVYQTQLAIWRATTGAYQDFAGKGDALAQEIYDESLTVTIPALPADAVSVDDAVQAGTLKVTIENFVEIPVEGVPGHPFHGQADLVIENVSTGNVKFVLVEGAVFRHVGADAQDLISHQNQIKQPELPQTGSDWANQMRDTMLVLLAGGTLLLLGGVFLLRRSRA